MVNPRQRAVLRDVLEKIINTFGKHGVDLKYVDPDWPGSTVSVFRRTFHDPFDVLVKLEGDGTDGLPEVNLIVIDNKNSGFLRPKMMFVAEPDGSLHYIAHTVYFAHIRPWFYQIAHLFPCGPGDPNNGKITETDAWRIIEMIAKTFAKSTQ